MFSPTNSRLARFDFIATPPPASLPPALPSLRPSALPATACSQIDLTGDDHETALYKAAAGGHAKIVDALLEHEAAPPNLEARAKVGRDRGLRSLHLLNRCLKMFESF